MQINCLSCGHKVGLGDAYDEYEGQVRCYICGSLLEIKSKDGMVKSVSLVKGGIIPAKKASRQGEAV